jgi:hypothetical protein
MPTALRTSVEIARVELGGSEEHEQASETRRAGGRAEGGEGGQLTS